MREKREKYELIKRFCVICILNICMKDVAHCVLVFSLNYLTKLLKILVCIVTANELDDYYNNKCAKNFTSIFYIIIKQIQA